ncbi:MAG: hypothetical protein AAFV47_02980 [Pseudomonadota bacterium]
MYISEKLAFVELHKTGGSHIGRWLAKTLPGEQIGKHNRLAPEHYDKFVVGSVRNPWDWYVSLWAYGCSSRGSVWKQTTDAPNLAYYRRSLHREMGRRRTGPAIALRQWLNDRQKPRNEWQRTYSDPNDPAAFQRWLKMMLNPGRSLDLREGYGFSWVAEQAGLMSYRYIKLFTSIGDALYQTKHQEPIDVLIDRLGFVDAFVRTEQLEPDLVAAIEAAQIELSSEQRTAILESGAQKTNTSDRRSAGFYYDPATIKLVAERERVIIERHGYTPPELESAL